MEMLGAIVLSRDRPREKRKPRGHRPYHFRRKSVGQHKQGLGKTKILASGSLPPPPIWAISRVLSPEHQDS
jgi:hypothetical protein